EQGGLVPELWPMHYYDGLRLGTSLLDLTLAQRRSVKSIRKPSMSCASACAPTMKGLQEQLPKDIVWKGTAKGNTRFCPMALLPDGGRLMVSGAAICYRFPATFEL